MKYLSMIIVTLITLVFLVLIVMNFNNAVEINLVSSSLSGILGLPAMSKTLSLGIYTLLIFILDEIAALFFFLPLMRTINEKNTAYKRQLEKTSVSNTESSSRVEVLEAKIKVLEKALEDALKKN